MPTSGSVSLVAQVIRKYRHGLILLAAFEATPEQAPFGPPRLIALTFDSSVREGEWTIVGHGLPDPAIPIPVYVVSSSPDGATYIQDLNGKLWRRATEEEALRLYNPVTYSPIAFQKAVGQIAEGKPLDERFAPMVPNWEYCEQNVLPQPP